MAKKGPDPATAVVITDPLGCPFREFRDSDLVIPDLWGVGPGGHKQTQPSPAPKSLAKTLSTMSADVILWVDEQIQPLPRSVRNYLHGWVRAEDLAEDRWDATVSVFDEEGSGRMLVHIVQLTHAQVLLRSSFVRRVLSACFCLELMEPFTIEHTWENFNFVLGAEGWRPRYHIYSPGMKPGGGPSHRPVFSRNGCYLVRLYYLGAWRCVWVNDQVPVDASGAPLLPFSPTFKVLPTVTVKSKQQQPAAPPGVVLLWPLLICKALLKLAAPDMIFNEDDEQIVDEEMTDFSILHCLTGFLEVVYPIKLGEEEIWRVLNLEAPVFEWDLTAEAAAAAAKAKSPKKAVGRDLQARRSQAIVSICDTMNVPNYTLPGITPCHETQLLVKMVRDIPLKRPLPEPDVQLWKTYRWVDWARSHGLYDDYACPRTKYLKVSGLLKLSYAPQMLTVESTHSLTTSFVNMADKEKKKGKDKDKDKDVKTSPSVQNLESQKLKEELRQWMLYDNMSKYIKGLIIMFFPSQYNFSSAASAPPVRITKAPPKNLKLDITAPKYAPMYIQIDGPEVVSLKIAFNVLCPRVLCNNGVIIEDCIEPAYLYLEEFEWFTDVDLPMPKLFIETTGYGAAEVEFMPGRHVCRLWIHSRLNWNMMLLTESNLSLGTRDMIEAAAVVECPWSSIFLQNLSTSFMTWVRYNRASVNTKKVDQEFYLCYKPDLFWDQELIGYNEAHVHWMFRKALEAHLARKLNHTDYHSVIHVLQYYFRDPNFGNKTPYIPAFPLRELALNDPCDCIMPEQNKTYSDEEERKGEGSNDSLIDKETMSMLLTYPIPPTTSNVCERATAELPCALLKTERDKMIKKHEMATIIQAHWRGYKARTCLKNNIVTPPDVLKLLSDSTFGNLECLSQLMNRFFRLFPGAKYAYSVGSALTGSFGLRQYVGNTLATSQCKWIPFFAAVFLCHGSVKVHLDLHSSLPNCTVIVYDNDTGCDLPQVYNTQITYNIEPNKSGYTLMGHGNRSKPFGVPTDVNWTLTVLSSVDRMFHICGGVVQNDEEGGCTEFPITSTQKLFVKEMFLPNRRNILGGIQVAVVKDETVRFKAEAVTKDLELIATLSTKNEDGEVVVLDRCHGIGVLYWPFIRLSKAKKPLDDGTNDESPTSRHSKIVINTGNKSPKEPKLSAKRSGTIANKITMKGSVHSPKIYTIEVTTPYGWPLTMEQWMRVEAARQKYENSFTMTAKPTKPPKDKTARKAPIDEDLEVPDISPDDAYVDLEFSYTPIQGAAAKRDDERDQEFAAALKSWEMNRPGRNQMGAELRQEFRDQYLAALASPNANVSVTFSYPDNLLEEAYAEESSRSKIPMMQGPSPTDMSIQEEGVEEEQQKLFLIKPERLCDKFIPLDFVPACTKEKIEDSILLSDSMIEAAKIERRARSEAATQMMVDFQIYNELKVLKGQQKRCKKISRLFVDAAFSQSIIEALSNRQSAISKEVQDRTQAAIKKKQEQMAETLKKKGELEQQRTKKK